MIPSCFINSIIIQVELAEIQKATARLCDSSEWIWRVRQEINMATSNVGTIIAIPSTFHPIHQLISFIIQKTIWRFSIILKRLGIE